MGDAPVTPKSLDTFRCRTWTPLLVLFVLFPIHHLSAQRDYIVQDSTKRFGVHLIQGRPIDNAQSIRLRLDGKTKTFGPDQVVEYGFKDGTTYQSWELEIEGQAKRYFLERISNGDPKVYYLRTAGGSQYFVTRADSLPLMPVPADKQRRLVFLENYIVDCQRSVENLPYVRPNRNNMKRFFVDYESCSIRHFPRLRYGLRLGLVRNRMIPKSSATLLSTPEYAPETAFLAGASVDVPIEASNVSVNTGFYYYNTTSSESFRDLGQDYDLVTNQSRLAAPILVRYTAFNLRTSPFIEFGPVYSTLIKNDNQLISHEMRDQEIYLDFEEVDLMARHQGGLSFGVGAVSRYGSRYSFAFEMTYSRFINLGDPNVTLTADEILVTLTLLY